jgi:hypothetical protein
MYRIITNFTHITIIPKFIMLYKILIYDMWDDKINSQ